MIRINWWRVVKIARNIVLFLAFIGLTVQPGASQNSVVQSSPQRLILVSIPDRKLALLEDDKVVKIYSVAVGATGSPSPTGEFAIVARIPNPTYYHPHVVIPASAQSPIGTCWLGLNKKGYGIHGTNEPRSIGRAASHGCIRMRKRDVAEFFTLVRVGDRVAVRAERDAQTARIFGGAAELEDQASPAQAAGLGE